MSGWIKLHRCLTKKAIWTEGTPEQKVILITLLVMANHANKEWEWKGEKYKALPGQFVTSLKSIAAKCGQGISIQNVRTALQRFEKYDFLTSESTNKNRLITIVNWGVYQQLETDTNNQTNKQLTSNQQAANKQLTTNKNVKNDKNVKNERINKTYSDNPLLNEAWESFVEMRKKIKAPLTDKAITLATNKLEKLASTDEERIAILNQSTMNCWKGLFELKDKKEKGGGHNSQFEANNDWKPTDLFD